MILRDRLHKRC